MRIMGLKSPDRADALLGCIVCGPEMNGAITGQAITRTKLTPFSAPIVGGFNKF